MCPICPVFPRVIPGLVAGIHKPGVEDERPASDAESMDPRHKAEDDGLGWDAARTGHGKTVSDVSEIDGSDFGGWRRGVQFSKTGQGVWHGFEGR